jgi:outer membrane protein
MKMTRNVLASAIAVASLVGMSASAVAYEAGDWVLRVGSATVDPSPDSDDMYADGALAIRGSDMINISSDTQMGISLTYMATQHFGIELLASTPFSHDLSAQGSLADAGVTDIGSIDHLPPTLTLQWYPMGANAHFQPYIGAGLNYTWIFNEELDSAFTDALGSSDKDFSLSNSFGLAAVVGVDFLLGDRFLLNVSAMYAQIDTQADINKTALGDLTIDVDINPWVYRANLGYRF